MDKCTTTWEKFKIMVPKTLNKKLLVEPKDSSKYPVTIDRFYKSIFGKDSKGGVLMGVCRGKISEGLDFSDAAARAVIIIGVPYPMLVDPRTVLKQEYLNAKSR